MNLIITQLGSYISLSRTGFRLRRRSYLAKLRLVDSIYEKLARASRGFSKKHSWQYLTTQLVKTAIAHANLVPWYASYPYLWLRV
ncbi:hypothetical protein [Allocoleopsis sp.]|uniref:hypothetical protein n=1 Tax=Allocoleopsis sp. TaxID=3088169 RepID=UPI002FD65A67